MPPSVAGAATEGHRKQHVPSLIFGQPAFVTAVGGRAGETACSGRVASRNVRRGRRPGSHQRSGGRRGTVRGGRRRQHAHDDRRGHDRQHAPHLQLLCQRRRHRGLVPGCAAGIVAVVAVAECDVGAAVGAGRCGGGFTVVSSVAAAGLVPQAVRLGRGARGTAITLANHAAVAIVRPGCRRSRRTPAAGARRNRLRRRRRPAPWPGSTESATGTVAHGDKIIARNEQRRSQLSATQLC